MQPPPYVSCEPGLLPLATPAPSMVVSVIPQHEVRFTQSQRKAMTCLSGLQIAIGFSCAIITTVLILVHRTPSYIFAYLDSVGAGIWCGGFYLIGGSLGVAGAKQNRLSLIITAMVFNILSSLILWVVVGFAASAIARASDDKHCAYYYCTNFYNYDGYMTADSILIILSAIELVLTIWCSVLCCIGSCKACCDSCCYGNNYGYPAQMIYAPVNSAGQQVIFVQQSGVVAGQATNVVPNQSLYVNTHVPLNFTYPTAGLAAAAHPANQPGVPWPAEYPAAQVGNTSADGPDCGQRVEVTKNEMSYSH